MSWRRAKTSSGWAAFDLHQKQKDIARSSNEPFPSLPNNMTSLQPSTSFSRNNHPYVKPFSSVIVPSVDFTATLGNKKSEPSNGGSSNVPQITEICRENKFDRVFKQLKECYSWADDGLIEDIMVAVDNDFEKASSFLKGMVSDESFEKNQHNAVVKSGCESTELWSNEKRLPGKREVPSEKISEPFMVCTLLDSHVGDENREVRSEFDLRGEKLSDGDMDINAMISQLTCVPIEPEWEEDDLYISCRKDAIKMMRAAARHSKSATNSFLRGDHFTAQQFSTKAREEWTAAKKLNEKAAREILTTRNENNGLWKLDLHGLHATEAVLALQERLYTIETQVFSKSSSLLAHPNSFGDRKSVV